MLSHFFVYHNFFLCSSLTAAPKKVASGSKHAVSEKEKNGAVLPSSMKLFLKSFGPAGTLQRNVTFTMAYLHLLCVHVYMVVIQPCTRKKMSVKHNNVRFALECHQRTLKMQKQAKKEIWSKCTKMLSCKTRAKQVPPCSALRRIRVKKNFLICCFGGKVSFQ